MGKAGNFATLFLLPVDWTRATTGLVGEPTFFISALTTLRLVRHAIGRSVQIGSHDVRDDDGHITPEDDAATRQRLINDSPYSCRYAIILHLIEETTRRGGGGHKHRKEALSLPRRINHHRHSVTPATSARASEAFKDLGWIWRKKRKQKLEGRTHARIHCSALSTQPSFLFISPEEIEKWLDLECRERKHT